MKPDLSSLARPTLPLNVSMAEAVTAHIRDWILTGQLQPGSRLVIRDLAGHLRVSPMPVREALVALSSEGLLVGQTHHGFSVAELPKRDIEDVFAVHATVAGTLAERAAIGSTPELVGRLEKVHNEIVEICGDRTETDSMAQVEGLNHEFHRVINNSVDATRLKWFLRAATRYVPRHFYYVVPGWIETTLEDHPKVIRAIATHNGARARKLMEEHVLEAGELVVDTLERNGYWG